MTVTDAEIAAKGREVRNKAVDVWIRTNGDLFERAVGAEFSDRTPEVVEALDFIVTMFESHGRRDPDKLDGLRAQLWNVRRTLEEPRVSAHDVRRYVSGWRGDAAESFHEGFLSSFDRVDPNQLALLALVETTLEAHAEMLRSQRQNIMEIGDHVLRQLEFVEEHGSSGGGSSGLVILGLTVVASVFGVLSTWAGPASWSITFQVIRGITTIGAGVAAYEASRNGDYSIPGNTVEEVVNGLVEANNMLWESVNTVERDMTHLLQQDVVDVGAQMHKYVPPLPEITDFGVSDRRSLEILAEFEPRLG